MLNSISWSVFLSVVSVLCGLYYLIVAFLYYGKDLRTLLKFALVARGEKQKGYEAMGDNRRAETDPARLHPIPKDEKIPELFKAMEAVVSAIGSAIEDILILKGSKDDVLSAIQEILGKYGYLKDTQYGFAINNYVIQECERNYSVRLKEDEVRALWVG